MRILFYYSDKLSKYNLIIVVFGLKIHFIKDMSGRITAYSFSSSSLFHATTNLIVDAVGL